MKKFLCVLTIALTATIATAGTAVYAEEAQSSYPELASRLTFTDLTSYAVNDGGTQFAFAEGNYIYVFEGSELSDGAYNGILENDGNSLYYYEHTSVIIDIAYDGGSLVFADGTGVYQIDGGKAVTCDYTFAYDGYTYYNNTIYSIDGGQLYYYEINNQADSLSDGTYSCLKICGDSLYVIKDNAVCLVEGSTIGDISVQTLTFDYLDLTLGETILTGNAAEVLSTVNSDVRLVTLGAGTYVTNVDLSDLSGNYFVVGSQGTFTIAEQTTYLYLGSVGSLYIISDGNDVYVTSDGGVMNSAEMTNYTITYALLNTAVNAYSLPYMCDATVIEALDYGAQVTVNGVYADDTMQCAFAYVTFTTNGGSTATGFVAVNFLTEYEFTAESGSYNEAEYVDGYSDENVILSVVLVMVIVVLVIIGIAYVSYSANRSKKKDRDGEDRE